MRLFLLPFLPIMLSTLAAPGPLPPLLGNTPQARAPALASRAPSTSPPPRRLLTRLSLSEVKPRKQSHRARKGQIRPRRHPHGWQGRLRRPAQARRLCGSGAYFR